MIVGELKSKIKSSKPPQVKLYIMPTVEYLNYDVVEDNGWDIYDEDNFEKAEEMDLSEEEYGEIEVYEGEYIFEAAEREGFDWPFSCRAGACANCAGIIIEGSMDMDMQQILSDDEVEDRDVRLTCIGTPETDHMKIVFNAKHLDYLQNRVI
jgi:2Fe-2S type ferredoxin